MHRWIVLPIGLGLATAAGAAPLRDYCPERPGIGTAACIVDVGHVSLEAALIDWTHDREAGVTTDTIIAGDVIARIGVAETVEVRIALTSYGHEREGVMRRGGVGDLALGAKWSLANPDGSGLSIALLPTVTVPTGRDPIGAGDWAGSLDVPASYEIDDRWSLGATARIAAEVDEDRDGRHLAYVLTGGVTFQPVDPVAISLEAQVERDRDPAGRTTPAVAGVSVGWMVGPAFQIDAGAVVAINHAAPAREIYVGVSRRF